MSQPITSDTTGPTEPQKTNRERSSLTPLQFELARALPALWKKANNRHLTAKEQHKKLTDLIIWVATKNGYTARQRYPIQFWENHIKKDGKVDLAILDTSGAVALLLEIDWTKNESSLWKLQAASISKTPVLWVVGVPCETKEDAKQLRGFANAATGKPTGWWLPIFHLVHSWI